MCLHVTHFQTFTAYNLPQGELRHTKLCILMHSLTALLRRNTPVEVTVQKRQEATVAKSFLQYKKYIYRFKKRKEKEKKSHECSYQKRKEKVTIIFKQAAQSLGLSCLLITNPYTIPSTTFGLISLSLSLFLSQLKLHKTQLYILSLSLSIQ